MKKKILALILAGLNLLSVSAFAQSTMYQGKWYDEAWNEYIHDAYKIEGTSSYKENRYDGPYDVVFAEGKCRIVCAEGVEISIQQIPDGASMEDYFENAMTYYYDYERINIDSLFGDTPDSAELLPGTYVLCVTLGGDGAFEKLIVNKGVSVYLNGSEMSFEVPPVIKDGRTFVPMRAIFEALGATIDWNPDTQTVTSTLNETTISMTVGENKMYKNGEEIELDVPSYIDNSRTLVPVRAISEAFDCTVDWDGDTKTVTITEK